MSTLETIRRALYKTQRGIGDYQALQRGPAVYLKRRARRELRRRGLGYVNRRWGI